MVAGVMGNIREINQKSKYYNYNDADLIKAEIEVFLECNNCHGSGKVVPQELKEFRKEWENRIIPQEVIDKFRGKYLYSPLTNYKENCLECNGEKKVKSKIGLKKILGEIAVSKGDVCRCSLQDNIKH